MNKALSGRPPKDPKDKIGNPVRCLVTPGVQEILIQIQESTGIPGPARGLVASDTLRVALYEHIQKRGLMTPELDQDPTWDSIKSRGLV